MSRSRNFCFTLNNYLTEELLNLEKFIDDNDTCKYLCYGKEIGEECKTPHLQGFISFVNARSPAALHKLKGLKRAAIFIAKGNADQNITYCSKGGDFYEFGSRPMSPTDKGQAEQERWSNILQLAAEGNMAAIREEEPKAYLQYHRQINAVYRENMGSLPDLDDTCGIWIWGDPGVGKSRKARLDYPNAYFKAANKWWCGYRFQENVIMDEVELECGSWLGHFLKIWTDRYCFLAETKGGGMMIRPKQFVVTSNYSPEQVFSGDKQLIMAIRRRFKITHMIGFLNGI